MAELPREPTKLYRPTIVTTTWFKHWAMQCWKCGRDFHRFAIRRPVKCPYCGGKNHPTFCGWI